MWFKKKRSNLLTLLMPCWRISNTLQAKIHSQEQASEFIHIEKYLNMILIIYNSNNTLTETQAAHLCFWACLIDFHWKYISGRTICACFYQLSNIIHYLYCITFSNQSKLNIWNLRSVGDHVQYCKTYMLSTKGCDVWLFWWSELLCVCVVGGLIIRTHLIKHSITS